MRRCFVSSKLLQFVPKASTRIRIQSESWSAPVGCARDIGFLRSWFENDFSDDAQEQGQINWGAISGLALSLAVSAAFWAGLVLFIEWVWK